MEKVKKQNLFYFLLGGLSVFLLIGPVLFFLLNGINTKKIDKSFLKAYFKIFGADKYSEKRADKLRVTPSKSLIREIEQKGGAFDNTKKLTKREIGVHQSFAVTTDHNIPNLGYILRPNIKLKGYFLFSNEMKNNDPPVLYLDNSKEYSKNLLQYLNTESYLSYEVNSNEKGFRKTIPIIESEQKVLVIGDSVAFGLGVDDSGTFPSFLQQQIGNQKQVINAALSGYNTDYNLANLERFKNQSIEHLIYIITDHDLDQNNIEDDLKKTLLRISSYRSFFKNFTIVLHSGIIENLSHHLRPHRFEEVKLKNEDINRISLGTLSKLNINFINWYDISQKYLKKNKSLFSPFALYADHCHFSKEGNRVLAKHIYEILFK